MTPGTPATVQTSAEAALAAVGAGLSFAAVSNTCAMGMLVSELPYNRSPRTDLDGVLAALAGPRP